MRRKAVKGEVLGRPPYGYRIGPRRRLELVPEEAVVVRYIFRLYLQEGMGIRKIAGQLNEESVATRRGGRWSMVTVRDLLRNRAYLGHYSRFGTTVTGSHPALVSAEDFRRVQDRLQTRHGVSRERTVVPFLLSGLVFCGRCGNKLIGVSRRQHWSTKGGEARSGSYRYYQCESRTNQSSCGYNTQRAAELEERVREGLKEGDLSASRVRRAGNVDSYLLDIMGQVDRIESKMKRTRRQVEELVADAAHGHITVERVKSLGGGLAQDGRFYPVVELMYADFIWVAADQMFNQIGKARHMFGGDHDMPLLLRIKIGTGTGYGSQHSMDPAGILATSVGWRIIAPSTALDYVGLVNAAMKLKDPVAVLEHERRRGSERFVPLLSV